MQLTIGSPHKKDSDSFGEASKVGLSQTSIGMLREQLVEFKVSDLYPSFSVCGDLPRPKPHSDLVHAGESQSTVIHVYGHRGPPPVGALGWFLDHGAGMRDQIIPEDSGAPLEGKVEEIPNAGSGQAPQPRTGELDLSADRMTPCVGGGRIDVGKHALLVGAHQEDAERLAVAAEVVPRVYAVVGRRAADQRGAPAMFGAPSHPGELQLLATDGAPHPNDVLEGRPPLAHWVEQDAAMAGVDGPPAGAAGSPLERKREERCLGDEVGDDLAVADDGLQVAEEADHVGTATAVEVAESVSEAAAGGDVGPLRADEGRVQAVIGVVRR